MQVPQRKFLMKRYTVSQRKILNTSFEFHLPGASTEPFLQKRKGSLLKKKEPLLPTVLLKASFYFFFLCRKLKSLAMANPHLNCPLLHVRVVRGINLFSRISVALVKFNVNT